jgi:hypothetical protein
MLGFSVGRCTAGVEASSLSGRRQMSEVRRKLLGECKIGTEVAIGCLINGNDKGIRQQEWARRSAASFSRQAKWMFQL